MPVAWWERQPVAGTMTPPLSLIALYETGGQLTASSEQRPNPMNVLLCAISSTVSRRWR